MGDTRMRAMGRWSHRIVGMVSLVWLAAPAAGDDATRAVAPDVGFTVQLPDRDWTCERQPDGYACHPREREQPSFVVQVTEPRNGRLSDADVQEYVHGTVLGTRNRGWRPEEPTIEPSSVPRAGFHRFSILTLVPPEGMAFVIVGYIGLDQVGREVVFLHQAEGTTEPAAFRAFVASYRWTGNVPPPLGEVDVAHAVWAAGVTALVGIVGWLVNARARRVVANAWKIAIVVLLTAAVALTMFWLPRLPARMSTLARLGECARVVYAPLALPLLFATWRAWAVSKRRRTESLSAPE